MIPSPPRVKSLLSGSFFICPSWIGKVGQWRDEDQKLHYSFLCHHGLSGIKFVLIIIVKWPGPGNMDVVSCLVLGRKSSHRFECNSVYNKHCLWAHLPPGPWRLKTSLVKMKLFCLKILFLNVCFACLALLCRLCPSRSTCSARPCGWAWSTGRTTRFWRSCTTRPASASSTAGSGGSRWSSWTTS